MSKSAILSSSVAKKYWMALTGLFLCTFLIGHLLGNLQLLADSGEDAKRAFNEYAYFMGHNIFIKVLSYLTYASILFHAIDGFLLAFQNKKARPQGYAYNNPGANSSLPSRYMAILGTAILVFIIMHMANFWYHMKVAGDLPLHTYTKNMQISIANPITGQTQGIEVEGNYILTTAGKYELDYAYFAPEKAYVKVINGQFAGAGQKKDLDKVRNFQIKKGTKLYSTETGLLEGEAYKDLYTLTVEFFSSKSSTGLIATILYVLAMFVLMFHLWHGFASAFQSLGLRNKRYTPIISVIGKAFAVIVPLAFAIIPIILYTR